MKETFLNALRNGGVAPDKMAEIRDRLGLPTELGTRVGKEQRQGILQARFAPLTRAQVRAILDEYADGGRGFTEESRAAVSRKDFAKGQAAANLGGSDAAKRDAINAEALQRHSQRGNASVDFSVTDALSILSGGRTLSDLDAARSRRIGGENAENERTMKNEELATGFARLFAVALKMLPADAHESEEFRLCGETVKLVKGDDGKLTAILGKGELKTNVALGTDVDSLVTRLIGRCVEDRETIGSLTLKGIIGKVYDSDIKAGLVASDRTSLTRKLASVLISMISSDRATGGVVNVDTILNGNYNTGLLVDIAQKALAGEDIGTKEKLDAYHAKIVRDTAALPPEIKAMLEQVANVPIEKLDEDKGEFIVRNPIVAGMNEVAPVPQQPAGQQRGARPLPRYDPRRLRRQRRGASAAIRQGRPENRRLRRQGPSAHGPPHQGRDESRPGTPRPYRGRRSLRVRIVPGRRQAPAHGHDRPMHPGQRDKSGRQDGRIRRQAEGECRQGNRHHHPRHYRQELNNQRED